MSWLLLVAALACGPGSTQPTPSPSPSSTLKVAVGDSPRRGPADAWVTLVEFADFECPFCRGEQPVLSDVQAVYGADLRLVFKHFPFHAQSQAAAVAAECAGEQGKFWEMHDLLFAGRLDDASLLDDATRIGLDVNLWRACTAGPAAASRVADDVALGTSLGVDATPTFVVNGVTLVGAAPEDDLRAAIDHARAAAVASGIPRADYYDEAVLGR